MKSVVDVLSNEGLFCRSLEAVLPKDLGSRKRIGIYFGVDTESYYCAVFTVEKRSRVLKKEAFELIELLENLKSYKDTNIKRAVILLKAPICSKARDILTAKGWSIKFLPFDSFTIEKLPVPKEGGL